MLTNNTIEAGARLKAAREAHLVARQGINKGVTVTGSATDFERGFASPRALVEMPLQEQQTTKHEQLRNHHCLIGRLLAKKLSQSVCIHCHDTTFVFHSIKEA